MKSVERTTGGTGETPRNGTCYRCGRTVAPPALFRIDVAPPAALVEKYADAVRYCCEGCAAGMNLSDVSRRWTASARRGAEPSDE
ncbi:hypothetical protein [Halovivax limisalsi]|uniref:hypothetical protein n=1 Tax=Halovivax limisalsi TaxID=1453760 RepID=UPI001FFD548F|nr:hypothetical protein [Halovivax limisalsi]